MQLSAAPPDTCTTESAPVTPHPKGHRYAGVRAEGYAVCEQCGLHENEDGIQYQCGTFPTVKTELSAVMPQAVMDDDMLVVQRTSVTAVSGGRDEILGMPRQLELTRVNLDGPVLRRTYKPVLSWQEKVLDMLSRCFG